MKHKAGSVTTQDLKASFEQTTSKDLTLFFDTWVYGNNIPKIEH
jgi:aminopeptidase N